MFMCDQYFFSADHEGYVRWRPEGSTGWRLPDRDKQAYPLVCVNLKQCITAHGCRWKILLEYTWEIVVCITCIEIVSRRKSRFRYMTCVVIFCRRILPANRMILCIELAVAQSTSVEYWTFLSWVIFIEFPIVVNSKL